MNRHYNITYGQFVPNSTSKNNVDVSKLDSIINHSASSIYCACFGYMPKTQLKNTYDILIEKLIPGGTLTIELVDIKNYCRLFYLNKISGDEFFNKIATLKSFISLDDIYVLIDNNTLKILQTISDQDKILITLERTKI